MEHQIKHLKETYKNKDIEFQSFNREIYRNLYPYPFFIVSNYTKKIYTSYLLQYSRCNHLVIPNSVKKIFVYVGHNYEQKFVCVQLTKFIQPTNTLKIQCSYFDKMTYDYSFAKYKLSHIITNAIFYHSSSFYKKLLHIKNMFLIEHISNCIYYDAHEFINNKNNKNNNLYIIVLKNVKNITIHNEKSHMFTMISILKNTYCLFLEFSSIDNIQYTLDLNNLCNVFELNIEYCHKITNTCKIIKNYKLYSFECYDIFSKFNTNKFIFSFIANLYMCICNNECELRNMCLINVLHGLNMMNTVRILRISCNEKIKNIPSFKYVDLFTLK